MSRLARLTRHQSMNGKGDLAWRWMMAAVFLHLLVVMVHRAAHIRAHVPLSAAAYGFVIFIILIGPLVGVALAWRAEAVGSGLVALTMAGAFIFGLVNHFLRDTPDHVANVAAQWQLSFA